MASSQGRMSLEVMGQSALGRDMFLVTVNALDTAQQRKDFQAWQQVRKVALTDPARGQALLESYGDDVKVPLYVQGAIHGNEYEGVDAIFETLDKLATTPYGADPEVDAVLDHTVLLFNVIQNPDGRVAGTRANGNGFDLNRDFMTQSQSETRASVAVMQKWLPPEVLDLHGYVTPTLIEATTKPHNPSIDYDLWLKWNQARIDANEEAMNAAGYAVTRPINDWCSDSGDPNPVTGLCSDGQPPGPAVAEGWDDWGPFYTPMYAQHVGLNGSTVEMCNSTGTGCLFSPASTATRGRLGARIIQEIVVWSTPALRPREPQRTAPRRARALPPRRGERAPAAVLRASVRRRQQLDGRVPDCLHRPHGQRAAQRARGQSAGRLAARQRHPRPRDEAGVHLRRRDLPQGFIRGLHESGAPRPGRHGVGHRRRHFRRHQHLVRAAGRVEPRLPLGR